MPVTATVPADSFPVENILIPVPEICLVPAYTRRLYSPLLRACTRLCRTTFHCYGSLRSLPIYRLPRLCRPFCAITCVCGFCRSYPLPPHRLVHPVVPRLLTHRFTRATRLRTDDYGWRLPRVSPLHLRFYAAALRLTPLPGSVVVDYRSADRIATYVLDWVPLHLHAYTPYPLLF